MRKAHRQPEGKQAGRDAVSGCLREQLGGEQADMQVQQAARQAGVESRCRLRAGRHYEQARCSRWCLASRTCGSSGRQERRAGWCEDVRAEWEPRADGKRRGARDVWYCVSQVFPTKRSGKGLFGVV